MQDETKLSVIKVIHTIIWLFYYCLLFYMLYAVIINKIDIWLWIGYGLVLFEALLLLTYKFFCPLTLIARRYSDSKKENFDIYLPNWLARYNKQIYAGIFVIVIILTVFRLAG